MPSNTVRVSRPSRWGNPFYVINEDGAAWISDKRDPAMPMLNWEARKALGLPLGSLSWGDVPGALVALYRQRVVDGLPDLAPLRGKNLACWCALDQPCHADVLLEMANRPVCEGVAP